MSLKKLVAGFILCLHCFLGYSQLFELQLTQDTICPNGCADISATIIGGQPPYNYAWTPIPNTGAGPHIVCTEEAQTYSLELTDGAGIVQTDSIILYVYAPPDIVADGVFDDCGNCMGMLDAVATGTPPFIYQWDAAAGSQTDSIATDLCVGTYQLTVTDGNGCSEFVILNIFGEDPVTKSIEMLSGVTCFEDQNGSATASLSAGGTAPFNYLWSNGETTQIATMLSGGLHTLTMTDSEGCEYLFEIDITGAIEILGEVATTGVACAGALGTAIATPTQGDGPFTYAWSNGDSGSMISNLIVGNYEVTIYDGSNCPSAAIPFEIIEEENVPQIIFDITEISCNGLSDGSIRTEVFGGEAGYSYLWSNGETTTAIEELGIGAYSLSVTDAVGCLTFGTINITEPAAAVTSFTTLATSCYNFEDGQIMIDTTLGGSPPYLYSIDNNLFLQNLTFENLAGGMHELFTQDAAGCIYSQMVEIPRPPELFVNIGVDVTVELGEIHEININQNAVGPTNFIWNALDSLNCVDSVANYCQSYEVLPTETGLIVLTVLDTAGCFGIDSILITVEKEYDLYLPNIFSPNDDGQNDVYFVQSGIDVKRINYFRIYDRWGSTLFEAKDFIPNDRTFSWDGSVGIKKAQSGIYLAVAEAEFFDGIVKIFASDIALIR